MFLIFQNDLAEKRKAETELHREETAPYAIVDRKLLHKPPPRIITVNGVVYQVSTDAPPPQTPPSDFADDAVGRTDAAPQPHLNPIPQQPLSVRPLMPPLMPPLQLQSIAQVPPSVRPPINFFGNLIQPDLGQQQRAHRPLPQHDNLTPMFEYPPLFPDQVSTHEQPRAGPSQRPSSGNQLYYRRDEN